jgi:hypothetical protein
MKATIFTSTPSSTDVQGLLSRFAVHAKTATLAMAMGAIALAGTAVAQSDFSSPPGADPNTTSLDDQSYVPGYGGAYPLSSTYEESVLRGEGAQLSGAGTFFQGIGQANYLTGQANIANEQARSLYLDNVTKHADTYWQRKAIYKQGLAQHRGQRPTAEDVARLARQNAPEGLTVSDFDAATGTLNWPEALMTPEFADRRAAIEMVVKRDGIGHRNVETLAEGMVVSLKRNVDNLDAKDYMAGKNFLNGLSIESSETPSRAEAIAENRLRMKSIASR